MQAGRLPASVQEIADVIGRGRALYLISMLPRLDRRPRALTLYVPIKLTTDHTLVKILGWNDAEKLVREFRGLILMPSACRRLFMHYRRQEIAERLAEGESVEDLAQEYELSERTVKETL